MKRFYFIAFLGTLLFLISYRIDFAQSNQSSGSPSGEQKESIPGTDNQVETTNQDSINAIQNRIRLYGSLIEFLNSAKDCSTRIEAIVSNNSYLNINVISDVADSVEAKKKSWFDFKEKNTKREYPRVKSVIEINPNDTKNTDLCFFHDSLKIGLLKNIAQGYKNHSQKDDSIISLFSESSQIVLKNKIRDLTNNVQTGTISSIQEPINTDTTQGGSEEEPTATQFFKKPVPSYLALSIYLILVGLIVFVLVKILKIYHEIAILRNDFSKFYNKQKYHNEDVMKILKEIRGPQRPITLESDIHPKDIPKERTWESNGFESVNNIQKSQINTNVPDESVTLNPIKKLMLFYNEALDNPEYEELFKQEYNITRVALEGFKDQGYKTEKVPYFTEEKSGDFYKIELASRYYLLPRFNLPINDTVVNAVGLSRFFNVVDFDYRKRYKVKEIKKCVEIYYRQDSGRWVLPNPDEKGELLLKEV